MRKKSKFFVCTLVVSVFLFVIAIQVTKRSDKVSDLALENVEALSDTESSSQFFRLFPCPYQGTQCVYSNSDQRPVCSSASYCP